jgi:outer membrane receptor protein involved in Fe transport
MRLALLLWIGVAAFAQLTGGGLTGRVLDPSQAALAGANVEIADLERGSVFRTVTDVSGAWRMLQLRAASYRITVSKESFQTVTSGAVRVEVDSTRRVDFTLPVAGLATSVEVRASNLRAQAADSGWVIERERVSSLPLNRRAFLHLALLTAGVQPPVQDSELSSRGTFAAHANGAREEFNNFLLDGIDNNDLYTNRYVLEPSVDTIQEFKITAGSYSAEYGRSAGAQVNVVTRGGSNDWHGLAYEYFRNRALDSANYFDADMRNRFARNQFGGVLGGPLRRDRRFVFFHADALRERRGLARLATVPPEAVRGGDLAVLGRAIVDPFTRQPFPGNRIPESRISGTARQVLNLFPAPSRSGGVGNLLAQPVLHDDLAQGGGRFDQHFGSSGILTLRYLYVRQNLFEPYAEESTDVPGFGSFVENDGHNAMLHHQRALGGGALHSLRIGLNRGTRLALPENHLTDAGRLWNAGWLDVHPRDRGFPFFNVQGYSPVGDATPLPVIRFTTTYQLIEDIAIPRGRHGLKFGFQARHTRANGNVDQLARGTLSFSGAISGAGISDLLLGFPSFTLQAKLDNTQTLRTTSYAAYAQDEIRITSRLNLTLGVRYEFNSPATDPFDRMSIYQPGTGRIVGAGAGGVSRSGVRADRNNFAPRAGFAWRARDQFVLRAGYGLYYDSGMLVVASSQYFNPPYFTLRAFFPAQAALITLDNPFPATGGISPVSPSGMSPDLSTSYLQHWSLFAERQIGASTVVAIGYAGSTGVLLVRSRDLNQARPGTGDLPARRPDPRYGGIFFIESAGNSNYHGLQATLDRRFSRRLSLLAAYTWSKSIDDTSAFLSTKPDKNFPQDSRNYRAERALSSFDIAHRLSTSFVVQLPGRSRLSRGWQVRGIAVAQTGQPFTPLLRFDNSNTGNMGGTFGSDRPNLIRDPRLSRGGPERWFDTAAFALAPRFQFGNAGRNIVRGPAYFSIDASLARPFALADRVRLTMEAQAFNLLNRTNFDLPERFADEPLLFGRIFSAKAARQAQIALRFSF